MISELIHISHHGRVLCHRYEAGMMFVVDFQEATGMNMDLLCPDCHRRHQQICGMIGADVPLSKVTQIGTAEKRLIVACMDSERVYNKV